MVLLDQGLSEIATEVAGILVKGQIGTSTTFEQSTDTGLISPITATLLDNVVNVSGNVIRTEYIAPPGVATGEDVSEYVTAKSDGTAINRKTFGSLIKQANIDLHIINTWRVKQ